MSNSLRSKIKHLAYKGEFNERERDRLLSALDHEIDVTYICDGKKCPECSKLCNHTTDISHAINFEPVTFTDEKTILNYEEKMPRYKPIILQEHDAEPRWIPISERLPEDGQDVLICDIDGDIMTGYHVMDRLNTHFSLQGSYEQIKNVKAWMPLPEPYKAESEERNDT